jgi:hypothetical protein
VAGVLLWLVTQLMGLMLTGAGHGWYGALVFSLPLVFLYPLALIRVFDRHTGKQETDILILILAAILDALLALNMLSNAYFMRVWEFDPAFVVLWSVLWAGWQPFIVASLLMPRNAPTPPGERVIDIL